MPRLWKRYVVPFEVSWNTTELRQVPGNGSSHWKDLGLRSEPEPRPILADADCLLVVLLDEADVFLEERTMADLQRNALVSGWL